MSMMAHRPNENAIVDGAWGPAQVRETHCAVVLFVGDRAYKMKKAINLGFLDFTAPATRKAVCHRELALNRRLAPDVYLDVVEVVDGSGNPCEWILVMRRMPEDRRLSLLVEQGADVTPHLRDLAKLLAAFHSGAVRGPEIDEAGSLGGLRRRWTDNLTEMEQFRGDPIDPAVLLEVSDRSSRYLRGREDLFRDRLGRGLSCDGHGDLIADDIFCLDDGPRALDCLEFDDRLRWVDGLDDASFLAMDLERLGFPALGREFLEFYAEFSATARSSSLEHHYVAYRAVVRAKVACLRYRQGVADEANHARKLMAIAVSHLRAGEPRLIIVGGSPGTGKSTLAGSLADDLGAVVFRSDRVRKESQGLDPGSSAAAEWEAGIYRRAVTEQTYRTLVNRAGRLLRMGETVILDASWSDPRWREEARQEAARCSSLITELCCRLPAPAASARLKQRAGSGDPSDADELTATQMSIGFAAWPEAVVVDTAVPADQSARCALAAIV